VNSEALCVTRVACIADASKLSWRMLKFRQPHYFEPAQTELTIKIEARPRFPLPYIGGLRSRGGGLAGSEKCLVRTSNFNVPGIAAYTQLGLLCAGSASFAVQHRAGIVRVAHED
jgi:hypothetical protein